MNYWLQHLIWYTRRYFIHYSINRSICFNLERMKHYYMNSMLWLKQKEDRWCMAVDCGKVKWWRQLCRIIERAVFAFCHCNRFLSIRMNTTLRNNGPFPIRLPAFSLRLLLLYCNFLFHVINSTQTYYWPSPTAFYVDNSKHDYTKTRFTKIKWYKLDMI